MNNNWIIDFIIKLLFGGSPKRSKPEVVKKEEEIPEYITMTDLLSGNKLEDQSKEIQDNLKILHTRVNFLRYKYCRPMTVTSGLRSMEHHIEVYAKKGITDKSKIPMGSQHLKGGACDIYDADGSLKKWIKDNEKDIETYGLWFESFDVTTNWVHMQIVPPRSGKRFFNP